MVQCCGVWSWNTGSLRMEEERGHIRRLSSRERCGWPTAAKEISDHRVGKAEVASIFTLVSLSIG